jgi:hypothetical protein
MATPRPYRDGWRIQIQKDGIRISETFKLKREAIKWALEQEAKKNLQARHTLRSAADKYLKTVTPDKRNALDWETRRFADFCAFEDEELGRFGDCDLADIDSAAIGRWRDEKLETVSGSTVLRYTNLYRNLFKLAWREWKWIDVDPYAGVRLPKENRPRKALWRWQQMRRIFRAGQRAGGKTLEVTQAFHVALRTAMRLSEALAAPEGLDRQKRIVELPPTKTEPQGETVPLTGAGYRLMLKTPRFEVGSNEASTLFSNLCKQCLIEGMEFRDSRATALTLMSRKMDILTLARISRHKNLELLRSTYYRESAEDISRRL